MRILITGGAGFIGSYLTEAELESGNEVIAFDTAPPTKIAHIDSLNLEYAHGNIVDGGLVDNLVKKVDLVYHLAAIANVQTYCDNPKIVLDVNIQGIQNVLKSASQHRKKIFFSSSSEMYGKNPKIPWKEDADVVIADPSRIRWCYAATKAVGEFYCMAYAKQGLQVVIGRFFNFYGPRLDALGSGRVITCFLDQFLRDKLVTIVKPGSQTRCFTYITDGIAGIRKITHDPSAEGKVFNIGTTRETTITELADLMKKIGNFKSDIVMVPAEKIFGTGFDDIPRRVPDTTRIRSLGWEPKISLEEGLKITIDSFRDKFNTHSQVSNATNS